MFDNFKKENIVIFFGKTGVGKTTLINTLFNLSWGVDNAVACTTTLNFAVHNCQKGDFLVVDVPGIAESESADGSYNVLYKEAISKAGHIIWVFQGDVRVYRPDQIAILKLKSYFPKDIKITLCMNQIDRIGLADWDFDLNQPSRRQLKHIYKKKDDIYRKFRGYLPDIKKNDILGVSSAMKFNTGSLYNRIIYREETEIKHYGFLTFLKRAFNKN